MHLLNDVKNGGCLVVEREGEPFHLFKQEAGLIHRVVFHQHQIALLHFLDGGYPEMVRPPPDLPRKGRSKEDTDVVLSVLAEFGIQFLADGRDRNLVNLALQNLETAALG